ncbi:helix-turn-helix domain-containing protein [Treponema primitia]|uniref:helix-turn-helix domain-containing protein n=1 Tax=Treponema primitia TaxID=88058 RepID=UPI00397FCD75
MEDKQFYTYQEFADIIGAHKATVQRWALTGKIKVKHFGEKIVRIPASELECVQEAPSVTKP